MRVAVLGATGVAGRAFVARATAAGHALVVDRVDILAPEAIRTWVTGCDAVVNLATSIPKPGGRGDWSINDRIRRDGTANLLAACSQMDIKVIVQQSVAMLNCVADDRPQHEDDPIIGYGVLASAADMECLVRRSSLDVRLVRGGLFYGPGTGREEQWLDEVRDAGFRVPGDGGQWITPVHTDDFAAALLTVLEHGAPRGTYIACDDAPRRLGELYALAAARLGTGPPATGGLARLRSFRVTNARLRRLGWRPAHSALENRASA